MDGITLTYHIQKKGMMNKMDKMISINTSLLTNKFCLNMRKNKDTICSKCYAYRIEKWYKAIHEKYKKNSLLLSSRILKKSDIPVINSPICRFHSIGELINDIHYQNFQLIANSNEKTLFTLWTKRIDIVTRNYDKRIKNIIHIYSSPLKNIISEKPKFFDKVFTVFENKFIQENNVKINCQKKCHECLLCYSKNRIVKINEVKK